MSDRYEFDRYVAFMTNEDPLSTVTLKGHLAVETVLDEFLESRSTLLKDLVSETFTRKMLLTRALSGREEDLTWILMEKLNCLQNQLATDQGSSRQEELVYEMKELIRSRDPQYFATIPNASDSAIFVAHTVLFIIGYIQGYRRQIPN